LRRNGESPQWWRAESCSVRIRPGHYVGDCSAGAGAILDYDGLAEILGERFCMTRATVSSRARREADDTGDRPA